MCPFNRFNSDHSSLSRYISTAAFVVILSFALFVPCASFAQSTPDTWENTGQFYGWVVSNYLHTTVTPSASGILIIYNPTTFKTVRFDYLVSDNSGSHDLLRYQWVFVKYRLDSEVGCVDGPNTVVRPSLIYRWSDECLCTEVWDKGLHEWVAND